MFGAYVVRRILYGLLMYVVMVFVFSALFNNVADRTLRSQIEEQIQQEASRLKGVTEGQLAEKLAAFRREFDVAPECGEAELRRAAQTSCALDQLVEAHRLGSLAYYYEGQPGNEYENIVTSVIAGNSLLEAVRRHWKAGHSGDPTETPAPEESEQLRKAVYVFILKRLRKSRAWGAVHKPGHTANS